MSTDVCERHDDEAENMARNWQNCWIIVTLLAWLGIGYLERERGLHLLGLAWQHMVQPPIPIQVEDIQFLSANLHLTGTLYTPERRVGTYPGVILCHGGTQYGRNLALYAVLARSLAEHGYIVVTFDFRGFGNSEDPHQFETFADLDFVQDIVSAVDYLTRLNAVDHSRLYVVGHSFGAGVAFLAGIRDARISKVVSISPGRGTDQRFFGENATEPDYPSHRLSADMKIQPPIPKAIIDPHLQDYTAAEFPKFPVHPPVLLLDGAKESAQELECLREVYDRLTAPKAYRTISNADHYFGTQRGQRGDVPDVPYDADIMAELTTTLLQWFRPNAAEAFSE